MHCLTAPLSAGEMAGGEVCSENKAWAVASRHSFFLEDTNVVFNGHWPHAHTPARRNVLCLGRTPVIKAVAVGREKPALQVLGLSVSCRLERLLPKEGMCFDFRLPTPPFLWFHELSCLHRKLQFSFLQLLFLHCKGFT